MTTNDSPPFAGPIEDPLLEAARANWGFAIAAVTGGLVVARLIAVAHGRVDVALGLLASAGIANVVIGSALSLLPFVAPLLVLALYTIARSYYREGRRALLSVYGTIAAIVASIVLTPVAVVAFISGALAISTAFGRFVRARGLPDERRSEQPMPFLLGVAGFPIFMMAAVVGTPWFPPETIVSNGVAVTGYVTSSDGRWTQVLLYEPRVVRIYETSAITSRATCQLPPDLWTMPLPGFVSRTPGLPDCPVP